jgi:hypothetical protein
MTPEQKQKYVQQRMELERDMKNKFMSNNRDLVEREGKDLKIEEKKDLKIVEKDLKLEGVSKEVLEISQTTDANGSSNMDIIDTKSNTELNLDKVRVMIMHYICRSFMYFSHGPLIGWVHVFAYRE